MNQTMTPEAARAWLDSHDNLETQRVVGTVHRDVHSMQQLVELLGEPQKNYPIFHITGTNGKTSTSRAVTRLLMERGLSVGTFVSPHLQNFNERWMYNLQPISDLELAEALSAIAAVEDLVDRQLSFFEIITATAFWWFSDKPVDVAVLEVGIGGRLDSTNVADADVAIITNVALDHQHVLGDTRQAIADEKAGIIKPNSAVILGENDPDLRPIFEARPSSSFNVIGEDFGFKRNDQAVGGRVLDIFTPQATYSDVFVNLLGDFQAPNISCAVAAVEAFFEAPLTKEVVEAALADASSPGRLEIVATSPTTVIDAAHNPAGAKAMYDAFKDTFNPESLIVVIGVLDGHDPVEMMQTFNKDLVRMVVTCNAEIDRRVLSSEIAEQLLAAGYDTKSCDTVQEAVITAREESREGEMVLIFGSLYVVGPARSLLMSG